MKFRSRSVFPAAGLALAICGFHPVSAPAAELIMKADFDNGSLAPLTGSGNAPTVQKEIKRSGTHAIKSHLDRFATAEKTFRTEATIGFGNAAVFGQEYWYAVSIYLPDPYPVDDLAETVTQWHAINDKESTGGKIVDTARNSPLALTIEGGKFYLTVRWSDAQPTLHESVKSVKIPMGPQVTGEWIDWVYRVKWSSDDTGVLQVWRNGVLMTTRNGPNAYNDIRGPYMKVGIYKSLWNKEWWPNTPMTGITSRTIYHDELRMAKGPDGYKIVAPGLKPVPPTLSLAHE